MRGWLSRQRAPRELAAADAYALWADDYPPEPHTPLMEIEQRAVLELLPDVSGRAALDLACGSGRYLRILAARGAAPITGCDRAPAMLRRAAAVGPPVVEADLLALPFRAGAFDVVVCGLALGDVADLPGVFAELSRVLAPGGVAVSSDIHPDGVRAGWKRTFRGSDGRDYAVRHHVHSPADYEAACRAAGLRIDAVAEPRVDNAGPWLGWPAALVVRARKA